MDTSVRTKFAVLHVDASEENNFGIEVVSFEIEEALSSAFRIVTYFLSESPNLAFDDIVGRGAAFSLYTTGVGERVWAGVCTELELEHSEEHTGTPSLVSAAMQAAGVGGPSHKGRSRYRLTIRPDLWRLSLRKNCRIFQHQTAAEIVKEVVKDWEIEVEEKLTEQHPTYEYKVQYNETDFDFISRMLEDAGISYWVMPAPVVPITDKKKGLEVTKIILKDAPHTEKPAYDGKDKVLPYMGDGVGSSHEHTPHIWMLSAFQQPKPLRLTIRDRDWRGRTDQDPQGMMKLSAEGRKAIESKYERFTYEPGAFWFEKQQGGGTPVADDLGIARISAEQVGKLPGRRYHSELAGRMIVRFKTNAFDLEPGTVFQIGKDEFGYNHKHPHPAFAHDKKLLIISRTVVGRALGNGYVSECIAVYADQPYFPQRITEKPKVYGVQSAVVVGPGGKEIYTDEFGRVRVQFPWDRYNTFNERSSCWLRVSQAWAGGGFGMVTIPRVGHEVLVSFFEGDPDQPIIVGRVYNATTDAPYRPLTGSSALGDNWTLTGIRTQSSPHTGGYNELMFQDQPGRERIHFQAQKDLAFVVNNSESHDVGRAVSFKVGATETHDVGNLFSIKVGPPGGCTELTMTPTSIKLTTGKASIVLDNDWIKQNAAAECHIHATNTVHLSSKTLVDVDAQKMTIDTVEELLLNCLSPEVHDAIPEAAAPAAGPSPGKSFGKPALPAGGGPTPEAPGGLEHVTVGYDVDGDEDEDEESPDTNPSGLGMPELPLDIGGAFGPLPSSQMPGLDGAIGAGIPGFAGPPAGGGALSGLDPRKILDMGVADQQAWLRKAYGDDMLPETLTKNIAGSLPNVGDGLKNLTNLVVEHAAPAFKAFASNPYVLATAHELLKAKGLPTSAGGVAALGMQRVVGALGKGAKGTLAKAFFAGATTQLATKVNDALGGGTLEALFKSTPAEPEAP